MSRRGCRAGLFILTVALTAATAVQAEEHTEHDWASDCAHCHLCDNPTHDDPCLKEYACPRHLGSDELSSELGPDVVVLNQLVDLYVPVYFTHGKHAEMATMEGGCARCHHYTPPNMPHPACRECHPATLTKEDVDQPGLKGAYHRQCLGCHVEWDQSTECEICHAKNAGGPLHGSATTFCTEPRHEPIEMKSLILFATEYDDGDQVPFHHENHVHKYGGECAFCHREQSCAQCHVHGATAHPMGDPETVDMHDLCYKCHDEDNGCEQCHGRSSDDLFVHDSTGWPLRIYHSAVRCNSCHDRTDGRLERPDPTCTSCHADGWDEDRFQHAVTGVTLDEIHGDFECSDCHSNGIGRPAVCNDCHEDERRHDRRAGSVVGVGSGG